MFFVIAFKVLLALSLLYSPEQNELSEITISTDKANRPRHTNKNCPAPRRARTVHVHLKTSMHCSIRSVIIIIQVITQIIMQVIMHVIMQVIMQVTIQVIIQVIIHVIIQVKLSIKVQWSFYYNVAGLL